MKKAKLLYIFLSMALILSLLGCTQNHKTGKVKEYATYQEVTLSLYSTKLMNSQVWSHSIMAKDQTKMRIKEEVAAYYTLNGSSQEYRQYILNQLKSESPEVDLYILQNEDVIEYQRAGLLPRIRDFTHSISLSEYAYRQVTDGNDFFCIPLLMTGYGFYWNLDLLEQYGLSVPKQKDEFLAVCETLKKNGITPYVAHKDYALVVPALVIGLSEIYESSDKEALLHDLATGKTKISDYMKKGFEFVQLLIDKGYIDVNDAKHRNAKDAGTDFINGKGACLCHCLQLDMSKASFEYQMTGIPLSEKGAMAVVGTTRHLTYNTHSPKAEYAKEFIDEVSKKENLDTIAKELHAISVTQNPDYGYLEEQLDDFISTVRGKHQIPVRDTKLPFETWGSTRDLIQDMLRGKTLENVMKEYNQLQCDQIKGE